MDKLLENYDANFIVIEALSNAIARYENGSVMYEIFNKRNSEIDPALATLKVLMDQGGLHATDFENEIGKESTVTKVLAGKKSLTKDHIAKLAERFGLPAGNIFLTDNYRMHAANLVPVHTLARNNESEC